MAEVDHKTESEVHRPSENAIADLNSVSEPSNDLAILDHEESEEQREAVDQEITSRTNNHVAQEDAKDIIPDPFEDLNEDLTPPPDTPLEEELSHASSPRINALEDEIVVNARAPKPSQSHVAVDQGDNEMVDADNGSPIPHYPKRKRISAHEDLNEDKMDTSMAADEAEFVIRTAPRPRPVPGSSSVKGVLLGYWRESPVPDEVDKHGVIGFIDVRDRLRTRIQPTNRFGKSVADKYPLPPGPGGSWVTFDKVCFDSHLVNLDHFQVKEYVKIRAETLRKDETAEETQDLNREAVKEAIRRLQENPPPDNAVAPLIAYGPEIPEHAQIPHRPEVKKRRLGSAASPFVGGSPAVALAPGLVDNLPGTRPTRIMLGYWAGSSEPVEEDRHAVYGILGANDMFRVKVTRETRDGRRVEGNFPTGAGALWIHWHEVKFEPHLQALSRLEVKEYVRVRQRQLDDGEHPDDRRNNEALAVTQAQMRVLAQSTRDVVGESVKRTPTPIASRDQKDRLPNGSSMDGGSTDPRYANHELRTSRRTELPRARHSLPDVDIRAASAGRHPSADAMERTAHIARREIARAEAAQVRADQRAAASAASRDTTDPGFNNKAAFAENISRLNKVWSQQEARRQQAGVEDAKVHNGVKYERKQTGPLQGKLVSQGSLISIDGEDYVEYRVLTKPTFF